jgi:phage terminase small subunit
MKRIPGKLTDLETKFARNLAMGMSYAKAHELAGYKPCRNAKIAYGKGKAVAEREEVKAYLDSLRKATWVQNFLSVEEKRSLLADIARAKPQDITEEQSFVSLSVDADGKRTIQGPKVSEKIKAIEVDARIAGELSDDNGKVNVAIQLINERLSVPSENEEPLQLVDED